MEILVKKVSSRGRALRWQHSMQLSIRHPSCFTLCDNLLPVGAVPAKAPVRGVLMPPAVKIWIASPTPPADGGPLTGAR